MEVGHLKVAGILLRMALSTSLGRLVAPSTSTQALRSVDRPGVQWCNGAIVQWYNGELS